MTVDQERLRLALNATAKQADDGSFLVAVRSDDLRVLRDAAAMAPFDDLDRADIIGARITRLQSAQSFLKRAVTKSEFGSVEKALNHPLYLRIEYELQKLSEELVTLA